MHRTRLISCACAVLVACSQAEEAEPPVGHTQAPRSLRAEGHAVWRLVDHAERMGLRAGGLFIRTDQPDAHKYVAPFRGKEGRYRFVFSDFEGGARAVELWARARGDHSVAAYFDAMRLGRQPLPKEWGPVRFELPEPQDPSPRRVLNLIGDFDLSWVRVVTGNAPPPLGPRSGVRSLGGRPRNALLADGSRTYSLYLPVPKEASLVFDYGAKTPTRFMVRVATDARGLEVLFDEKSAAGRWSEARVDLSDYAGMVVRLDLSTEGEGAAWGEPEIVRSGAAPLVPPIRKRPKNLLLIVEDTVRKDVFSAFDPETVVETPSFTDLAKESTLFTRAYSNAPWTKPSVSTIWSGLYPTTHGAQTQKSRLSDQVPLLSERLAENGFTTALFSSNPYVSERFGLGRGFGFSKNYAHLGEEGDAKQLYDEVFEYVEEHRDGPFFVHVQAFDPHVPCDVPEAYWRRYDAEPTPGRLGETVTGPEQERFNDGKLTLSEGERRWLKALYYGEVTYHDEHLGRFIQRLKKAGVLEDTLLIVTNDHGEELFDHGKLGHGHTLYDELIDAPLLIRHPGTFPMGARVQEPVELVDLAPTIFEVLGIPPLEDMDGLSFYGAVHGRGAKRPAYAVSERLTEERAIRFGRYLLIARRNETLLFDLEADPDATENLADERPIARRSAEVHLYEALQNLRKAERGKSRSAARRRYHAGDAKLDADLRRQLRALGYLND